MSDKTQKQTELETKLAWLERFTHQLNEVVIDQEKRLEAMEVRLQKLENGLGGE